jgi:DivIVA domain-containing protein
MGIQDVAGWVLIVGGTVNVGRALPALVRARRSEARPAAAPVAVCWSALLVGLGLLVSGVLYLRYPRYPHGTWLGWIPGAVAVVALIPLIAPWIVSRLRARRLSPGSADAASLGSADMPGPGPAIAPDARTAGLIERIKNVKFGTVRLAPGYDEEEVDTFLDKLVAALSQDGQLNRSELRDIRFSTTRLRPGYAMPDVDTFLAEVARATW